MPYHKRHLVPLSNYLEAVGAENISQLGLDKNPKRTQEDAPYLNSNEAEI